MYKRQVANPLFSNDLLDDFKKSNPKKLGIALVGLGNYSKNQLAPALEKTEFCELKAVVTGTPSKAKLGRQNITCPGKIFTIMKILIRLLPTLKSILFI